MNKLLGIIKAKYKFDWLLYIEIHKPISVKIYVYRFIYKFRNKKIEINILINPLLEAILSLMMFYIMYKNEIKIINDDIAYYISIFLKIMFIYFICFLIYTISLGIYNYVKKRDIKLLGESFIPLYNLINFLINYNILIPSTLSIILIIQYNLIFLSNILILLGGIFFIIIYDFEIKGKSPKLFLNYPFIILIIIILLLYLKKDLYIIKLKNLMKDYIYID